MDILGKVLDGSDVTYDQKCVPLLWLSGQEIDARMNLISSKYGLTTLQNLILYYLDENKDGTMTINELSECLSQKANTSRSVAQLVKMEVVTKTRSEEDERVVYVTITDKGKELKKSAEESLSILNTVGLNEEDAKKLYDLLFKVMTFQATQNA
jgi:MarR family transcriptional regulator